MALDDIMPDDEEDEEEEDDDGPVFKVQDDKDEEEKEEEDDSEPSSFSDYAEKFDPDEIKCPTCGGEAEKTEHEGFRCLAPLSQCDTTTFISPDMKFGGYGKQEEEEDEVEEDAPFLAGETVKEDSEVIEGWMEYVEKVENKEETKEEEEEDELDDFLEQYDIE